MDAIGKAIEANGKPPAVDMIQIPVTISSSGRPAMVALPADVTDVELLEIIGWLGSVVAPQLRARRPASRLVIARA